MKDNLSVVKKDVNKVLEIVLGDKFYNYRKIYPNTNENLDSLFKHFSVEDKDVFSVLASSDQVFTSFYKGAKSVDSFDINKLTVYYYYLRKWVISEYKEEYINTEHFINSSKIRDLVNSINSDDEQEQEAIMFWITYFTKYDKLSRKLFLSTIDGYDSVYKDDLDGLSSKIKNMKFYNLDIGSRFVLNKKYDVLILSNILECLHHPAQMFAARDNVERLLNKDGICVCSHLMEGKNNILHRNEIEVMTSGNLEEEDFDDFYLAYGTDYRMEVGYVYRKK